MFSFVRNYICDNKKPAGSSPAGLIIDILGCSRLLNLLQQDGNCSQAPLEAIRKCKPRNTTLKTKAKTANASRNPGTSHRGRRCYELSKDISNGFDKILNTARKSCSLCGASSFIHVTYGATNTHSSSVTSLGYGFLVIPRVYHPQKCITGSRDSSPQRTSISTGSITKRGSRVPVARYRQNDMRLRN